MRRGFTIIEVVVVFLLILGVTFLVLPNSLNTTKQARFISKWADTYSELQYIFSVIKTQKDGDIYVNVKKASTEQARKEIVLTTIKPYLRIKFDLKEPKYRQYYMDKKPVRSSDMYSFSNYYVTDSGEIVGIKLLSADCNEETKCGVLSIDLNGEKEPNAWGRDIFGVDILKDSIEPIGKRVDPLLLKSDCAEGGRGIYCSYYYLVGGKFD